ncbi:class I SAM-dependent methyltransferase [Dolichospermum circinale]|uniref:class I SAM-dependent methyltransferase n=1 Tax=Dolichospermum circinale TaxID=109265 RepID=UPI00232CB227|nr:class I SAM-dependent methyltransferase [Dolichospermum circinale]MDB9453524.1 class I SAM-dependent methyltransferase [Dolichospermum circinale CS-541/06]MDB9462964.1 class I SAM-dependent methyltransferase [Dolichospermum circinale CS-541/04]MDB9546626.1 class I SAM-dependent methyltransferase [Dolichospermum circinale CS-1031]
MINNMINNKKALFDRWANSYDWTFPSFIYQAIHKRLLSQVELSANANVLDLGCGTGRLLNRLANQFPEITGTGLDLSPQMLRVARQNNRHRPRLIYLEGNAENLPFVEGQFDAVFNTISFLHYPQPDQVLKEVARVLSPGGKFYLVDITFNNSSSCQITPHSPTAVRFYSQKQREEMGNNAGLICLKHHHLLGFVLLTIFQK